MALRLLTEADARAEWIGNLLIVRQHRIAYEDLLVMLLRTAVVALVTLPLWRFMFVELIRLPYWLALVLAGGCFALAHSRGRDLRAARQPGSWLLVANRRSVWLNFRSYRNWQWPAEDKTVMVADLEDIRFFVPLRPADGSPVQLALRLHEPLSDEVIATIWNENNRVSGPGFLRGRGHTAPVVVENGLRGVRVRWQGEFPTLREAADKLRLNFPVEPMLRIDHAAAGVLTRLPQLDEEGEAEINALLHAGDRQQAARRLCELTGISLKEAREIVNRSGWQDGAGPETEPAPEGGASTGDDASQGGADERPH